MYFKRTWNTRFLAAVFFACVALSSTPLLAVPVLEGNLISWPDDGWYQVQRANDFVSICEGTRSCIVDPGQYIVINHTTGQRFKNIFVSAEYQVDDDSIGDSPIRVQGNVIQWPDDGWYQVQRTEDYQTVCEGVRECAVPPGSYTVINHSLGIRYKNIIIEDNDNDGEEVDFVIDDTVIRWTGDGWFQVQSEDDYSTVCEGRINACETGYGEFQLINLTTGQRWDDIVMSGSQFPDAAAADINLENVDGLLLHLVSVVNEEPLKPFSQLINTVTNLVHTDTTNSTNNGFEYLDTEYFPPDSSPLYQVYYYRCVENNGEMSVGRTVGLQQNGGEVDFHECKSTLVENSLVNGNASYDWTLIKYVYNPGSDQGINFNRLELANSDAQIRTLEANLRIRSGYLNSRIWRDFADDVVAVDYLKHTSNGNTIIIIDELNRSSGTTKESDAPPWSRRLRANFTVQSPQTGNRPIVVSTDEDFVASAHESCFDTGVLTATGVDGSWLKIDAGNSENNSFELTVHTKGITSTRTVPWTPDTILKQLDGAQDTAIATESSVCAGFYIPLF